ncbi:MAG: FecR domain-containing protein [Balneolaceae bacterium]
MESDPKHEECLLFLKQIWDHSGEEKHSWDVDAAWKRFSREYDLSPDEFVPVRGLERQRRGTNQRRNLRMWQGGLVVAVSFILIFTTIFFLSEYGPEEEQIHRPEEVVYREIETGYGQRTHLNLDDGSRIVLNAGSRIRLPESFDNQDRREVYLSGEAWFDVAPDTLRSFVVYTEQSVITVLGTKFQVQSYPAEDQVQVVVSEGSVALKEPDKPDETAAILTRSQLAIISADGITTVETVGDLSVYLGWTEGKFVFDRSVLKDAIKRLERWYDVKIRIDPSSPDLPEKKLTASFEDHQPVREVLETIALKLDIHFVYDEQQSVYSFFRD